MEYWSSPGHSQEVRSVQVIHQPHSSGNSNTSGGLLAAAAVAAAATLQSVKDASSGK